MKYTKKIFVIMFSFFIIAVLVSFSYAHFIKDDVEGNAQSTINIATKSEGDYNYELTSKFENSNVVDSGYFNDANYQLLKKFQVNISGGADHQVEMILTNTNTNIDNQLSSFQLYQCNETNYENVTTLNIGNLCTNVGDASSTTLPYTLLKKNLLENGYVVLQPQVTYYYVLLINIDNVSQALKYFKASIVVDFYSNRNENISISESIMSAYEVNSDSSIDYSSISSSTNGQGLYVNNKVNLVNDTSQNSIYFFRGNVNNYLFFAGQIWRVMSIQANGTVRIILQDTPITNQNFNTLVYHETKLVGYTYDDSNSSRLDGAIGTNSNLKNQLETWYTTNLAAYSNYINLNAFFCNDTSFENRTYGYSAYTRNITSSIPTFSCPSNTQTFGGLYSLFIGTISADEFIYAGGSDSVSNTSFYLYNGTNYWTMSPSHENYGCAGNCTLSWNLCITNAAVITTCSISDARGIRPVIELNADVVVTGTGTQIDPWVVQ